jgi:hypothetical protein
MLILETLFPQSTQFQGQFPRSEYHVMSVSVKMYLFRILLLVRSNVPFCFNVTSGQFMSYQRYTRGRTLRIDILTIAMAPPSLMMINSGS